MRIHAAIAFANNAPAVGASAASASPYSIMRRRYSSRACSYAIFIELLIDPQTALVTTVCSSWALGRFIRRTIACRLAVENGLAPSVVRGLTRLHAAVCA